MHGTTSLPMECGELCFIHVQVSSRVDAIGPLAPEDLLGRFCGQVIGMGLDGQIQAVFTDPRITKNSNPLIAQLDGCEPPFAYTVIPRFRMQGLTTHEDLELHDRCIVQIGRFDVDPDLCDNPGMTRQEVVDCFPRELIGLWEGRVIYTSSHGIEAEGGRRLYPIAAVLADGRITRHENEAVRRWACLEPPVRYSVHAEMSLAEGAMHVTKWWRTVRDEVMLTWSGVKETLDLTS